jgi:hypothetical protein
VNESARQLKDYASDAAALIDAVAAVQARGGVWLRARFRATSKSGASSSSSLLGQGREDPPRVQRQLVVGDEIGLPLRRGQVPEDDAWNRRQAHLLCRHDAAVAGDDSPSESIRIGFVKPNSTMIATICVTCAGEWVRAFFA